MEKWQPSIKKAIPERMREQGRGPASFYPTVFRDSRRNMVRSPPETTELQRGTLPYDPASQQGGQYRHACNIKVQDAALVHSMIHCGPSVHERERGTLVRRRSTKQCTLAALRLLEGEPDLSEPENVELRPSGTLGCADTT